MELISTDGQARQTVGQGGVPFWLDGATYGFVQMGDAGWEVVTAVIPQNQPRFLFSQADLLEHLPVNERDVRTTDIVVNQIVANPQKPSELLVQVNQGGTGGASQSSNRISSSLLRLTLADDLASVEQIELLRSDSFTGNFGFSPDGRYIIVADYSSNGSSIEVYLLDQQTGQATEPFTTLSYTFPWTPDGNWFIQETKNYLLLHAPAYDYQYLIPSSLGNCPQIVLSEAE
ncbi:MAG: hypothetical protein H6656_13640 [Ardenticatenaceae bacterium]|nr:hypothetical protein [Ardenticatenaceae bacterium]